MSEAKVIEAARRVTGQSTAAPQASRDSKKNVQVSFSATDLKGFNTDKTTLIKTSTSGTTEEEQIMKSLFVTQSKEAMEEFEQEKENEVELQLGNSVAKPDLKQGWGEWAGAGVN